MSKRNEAVTEEKHGNLDADASRKLDALLGLAGRNGVEVEASQIMSAAIRLYFELVSGRVPVTVVPPDAGSMN